MKIFRALSFILPVFFALSVHALDPVAPHSERKFGIVYVKGPQPGSDEVILTNKSTGETRRIPPGGDKKVPVGEYNVSVKMQEYQYSQDISVTPTERTDVVVPGYGNIKVNGATGKIEAYRGGALVDTFDPGKVKTVPTGEYDLKVPVGNHVLTQSISVVTNTTRQVDVKLPKGEKKRK